MSSFCGNCGAEIAEENQFCQNCGSPRTGGDFPQTNSKKKKGAAGIIVAVVAIVVVVVLCISLVGGKSYQKVIETYVDSSFKNPDAATLVSLFPDELFTYVLIEEDMSRTEAINELQEELEDQIGDVNEYCEDLTVSWSITNETDASKSEVKFLSDDLEDIYGFDISAKKDVTVELSVDAVVDGESVDGTQELEITLIKSGSSWYLWGVDGTTFDEML